MAIFPSWTREKKGGPVDPLNIIFENISLGDIAQYLHTRNWSQTYVSNPQFLFLINHDDSHPCDMSLQKGNPLGRRLHLRLWDLEGFVIGSVHLEKWNWNKIEHEVIDFELGEISLSDDCKGNHNWQVQDDIVWLSNYFSDYSNVYNDGSATRVWI